MKKIVFAIAAVMFVFSLSSYGLNLKREACKQSCETAKDECYEKAKDKEGKTDNVKKAACDATYSECVDRCNKVK